MPGDTITLSEAMRQFGDGGNVQNGRSVSYDDVSQGESVVREPSLDKAQPGANTPVTSTTPSIETARQSGWMEDGIFTMDSNFRINPQTTDNANYNNLEGVNVDANDSESNFTSMVAELMNELTQQVFVYPEDLGSNPELLNYIQIEMYETGGQGLSTQSTESSGEVFGFDLLKMGINQSKVEKIQTAVNSTGGQAAIQIAGALTVGRDITEITRSGILATVGKGVYNNFSFEPQFGSTQFGFVKETTGFTTANKKINKTICLYMPTSVKTNYGVEYTEEDFSAITQAVGTIKATAQTVSNFLKGIPQNESTAALMRGVTDIAGRQALDKANNTLSSIASPLSGGEDLKLPQVYSALSRKVQNPFIVNMYKSTKRRIFDFSFRFLPRSREEMTAVYNIITTLKKYSLPRRVDEQAGRLLEYPAEFSVKFFHNGKQNLFLPKIGRCALKDVGLNYGDEVFTTFAPLEGVGWAAPTKIDLTLSFEELEILTSNRIEEGF